MALFALYSVFYNCQVVRVNVDDNTIRFCLKGGRICGMNSFTITIFDNWLSYNDKNFIYG